MNEKYITLNHLTMTVSALLNKLAEKVNTEDLAEVAFSGNYGDLNNTPNLNLYALTTDAMIKGIDYVTAGQFYGLPLGDRATAEGRQTVAAGNYTHTEGSYTLATKSSSHAEGVATFASGNASHSEGVGNFYTIYLTKITDTTYTVNDSNINSRLFELLTEAVFYENSQLFKQPLTASIVDFSKNGTGELTSITTNRQLGHGTFNNKEFFIRIPNTFGESSHTEGGETYASGDQAHAEGRSTYASGDRSHAEGYFTTASSDSSHAEGYGTVASGSQSHSEGYYTIANHASQHVFGEYNTADTSSNSEFERGSYIEIVGNGTTENARSNARTLDWSGNETLAGTITIGGVNGWTLSVDVSGNMTILPASS